MEAIPAEVAERAATRYEVNDEGCWITTYAIQPTGYAYIAWQSRESGSRRIVSVPVHRAALQHHTGVPPRSDGQVDHVCHDPARCLLARDCPHRGCVRPDHLLDGPIRDNVLRASSRAAENARKVCCPRCGGPYAVERKANGTYIGRRCHPCRNAAARSRIAARRDEYNRKQRERYAQRKAMV